MSDGGSSGQRKRSNVKHSIVGKDNSEKKGVESIMDKLKKSKRNFKKKIEKGALFTTKKLSRRDSLLHVVIEDDNSSFRKKKKDRIEIKTKLEKSSEEVEEEEDDDLKELKIFSKEFKNLNENLNPNEMNMEGYYLEEDELPDENSRIMKETRETLLKIQMENIENQKEEKKDDEVDREKERISKELKKKEEAKNRITKNELKIYKKLIAGKNKKNIVYVENNHDVDLIGDKKEQISQRAKFSNFRRNQKVEEEKKKEKELTSEELLKLKKSKIPLEKILIIFMECRYSEDIYTLVHFIKHLEKKSTKKFTIASSQKWKKLVTYLEVPFITISSISWSTDVLNSFDYLEFLKNDDFSSIESAEEKLREKIISEERRDYFNAIKNFDLIVSDEPSLKEVWSIAEKFDKPLIGLKLINSKNNELFTEESDSNIPTTPRESKTFTSNAYQFVTNWFQWRNNSNDINTFRKTIDLPEIDTWQGIPALIKELPFVHVYGRLINQQKRSITPSTFISGFFNGKFCSRKKHSREDEVLKFLNIENDEFNRVTEDDVAIKPIFIDLKYFPTIQHDNIKKLFETVIKAIIKVDTKCIIAGLYGWEKMLNHILEKDFKKFKHRFLVIEQDVQKIDEGEESHIYDWIFPHCSIVLHNGNSLTTSLCLWNGCVSVVCSFIPSHINVGNVLNEIECGTIPLKIKEFTSENLVNRFEAGFEFIKQAQKFKFSLELKPHTSSKGASLFFQENSIGINEKYNSQ